MTKRGGLKKTRETGVKAGWQNIKALPFLNKQGNVYWRSLSE